ncbi:hypothetical protein HYU16_03565 [Candidatus Woesearchaeota archaeon]|nr:hypothetical protein [Candidatus Woesearchaeota archaeon]
MAEGLAGVTAEGKGPQSLEMQVEQLLAGSPLFTAFELQPLIDGFAQAVDAFATDFYEMARSEPEDAWAYVPGDFYRNNRQEILGMVRSSARISGLLHSPLSPHVPLLDLLNRYGSRLTTLISHLERLERQVKESADKESKGAKEELSSAVLSLSGSQDTLSQYVSANPHSIS